MSTTANYAIIDSGTSMLIMSTTDYATWQSTVYSGTWVTGANGIQGFPCSGISSVPTLGFQFSTYTYTIQNSNSVTYDGTNCYPQVTGGLDPSNGDPPMILGDQFCTSFYIQFDTDNSRIGIMSVTSNPLTGSIQGPLVEEASE